MHRLRRTPRALARLGTVAAVLLGIFARPGFASSVVVTKQVVVLGGGSAGVGAAISAARQGVTVALIDRTGRLGNSTGVAAGDNAKTYGVFDELRWLMRDYYAARGQDAVSQQGRNFEPSVELTQVNSLLARYPNIAVYRGYTLANPGGVRMSTSGTSVASILALDANGTNGITFVGNVFVDATDAGDLLGQAGLQGRDWTLGREGQSTYGEEFAGEVWTDADDPSTGHYPCQSRGIRSPCRVDGSGAADSYTENYTFRVILQYNGFTGYTIPADYQTNRSTYYVNIVPPAGDPSFAPFVNCLQLGQAGRSCLPNSKMDLNADPPTGWSYDYATANEGTRRAIEDRIKNFLIGYIHFLRTERNMPWIGLSTNDYSGNFPPVLYVREGRRALGVETITERHGVAWQPELSWNDSIAINEYGLDVHCVTTRSSPVDGNLCEGKMWLPSREFQIPYGVLVPRTVDGLLVARAVSASHVGFASLRIEQQNSAMGQAAGTAAALAIQYGLQPRQLLDAAQLPKLRELQYRLASQGVYLKWFGDLKPFSGSNQAVDSVFRDLEDLAVKGALPWFSDANVLPNNPVTRAEATKVIAVNLGLPLPSPCPQIFSDVPSTHWACPYVYALVQRGAIGGYSDGTFRPDNAMTRAQASKVTVVAAGLPINISSGAPHFWDVTDPSAYYYNYAETLWTYNVVRTAPFRAADNITRGELATFAVQTGRAAGVP